MKLLALGDVVGNGGCDFLRKKLPGIKKLYSIDICIANGENSATGNGILPYSADHLFASGVDFITTGNHVFRRSEIHDYLDERTDIIRPYNMHPSVPGHGVGVIDMLSYKIGVINLIGTAYQNSNYANPFDSLDKAIEEIKDCRIKIVDFHAESTGEKRALGLYADSRVSVFFGTHTHVQTADAQILPQGTGYITDLGMCGSVNSVLGVESECVIKALKTGLPTRFKAAEDNIKIDGCIFEIDEKTGLCLSAEPISVM
ncbi:MAG: TIGR00282 family metallophosphoesterase [Clostridia bacterium]|nr:TIGR00282 family metallophosphoesterase [Clostridia bacterium]